MQADGPTVYILDEDFRIREALSDLLHAFGYKTFAFERAQDFISYKKPLLNRTDSI